MSPRASASPRLPRFVSVDEVAESFGVARNTVWKWIRTGTLAVVRVGKVVRIPRASFDALVAPRRAR